MDNVGSETASAEIQDRDRDISIRDETETETVVFKISRDRGSERRDRDETRDTHTLFRDMSQDRDTSRDTQHIPSSASQKCVSFIHSTTSCPSCQSVIYFTSMKRS